MSSDAQTGPDTRSRSTDPFIAKLRAARESLPVGAQEIRYRLKELEWRLAELDLDDAT